MHYGRKLTINVAVALNRPIATTALDVESLIIHTCQQINEPRLHSLSTLQLRSERHTNNDARRSYVGDHVDGDAAFQQPHIGRGIAKHLITPKVRIDRPDHPAHQHLGRALAKPGVPAVTGAAVRGDLAAEGAFVAAGEAALSGLAKDGCLGPV